MNDKTDYLFFVKAFKLFKHIKIIITRLKGLCQGIFEKICLPHEGKVPHDRLVAADEVFIFK